MRIRPGVARVLFAVVGVALLVLPVGTTIPDGVLDLASGRAGLGVLGALLGGGSLARAAATRVVLSAACWTGFVLAGTRSASRPIAREARVRCPACGFVTARRMVECPACGALTN